MSNSKKMITQISKIVGKSINAYYPNKLKSKVDDIKFKEAYQGRIIDCMVGEVDDNYIETPETDAPIVKLEHSKEGVVKIPSIKGKTILVDADGNETDTPGEGCRLVSVGEDEENKLIILSKNADNSKGHKTEISLNEPLRRINNTIYDEIEDKKIIRKIGKVTLNGSEKWSLTENEGWTSKGFNFHFNNNLANGDNLKTSYKYIGGYNSKGNTIRGSNNALYIFDERDLTLDEFKEWLSNNNVEVIYELSEPIIEELPNGITLQGYDDTTMYIENSITPTVSYGYNALIPYKEELLTQKEEVETNTLDIEQNIIPYLMDMEFNLMLMEDNK